MQPPAATTTQPATPPAAGGPAATARPGDPNRFQPRAQERFAPGLATGERRGARVDELRALRRERVEDGGRRVVIDEPDRRIIREGNRTVIIHDETERLRRVYSGADVRTERRGEEEVTIVRRPNGVEIITVRDEYGNVIRRVRREPNRREVVLFDDVGGRPRGSFVTEVVELPPPVIRIPREKYVVEVDRASSEDLYEAFTAPPIERIERRYSLEEVRRSASLRERVRRVDVDTVTFDSGSWTLAADEVGALTGVANAILRAVEQNPGEVFLVEGHTDAVGNDVDNLSLSDRRAETVATVLSERFQVPAENLTTQGYGEQYLKISTQGPERENRRVTIRRITPLLQNEAAAGTR
ncbi:MAG TPA: OmpA family protein [Beijerinckiaceae bacterium]|jgi:outer membrane protein OmpA-like peptidoglycan-associated protein